MRGNVLIIGASGDIGVAIAKELANAGYGLLLHYHQNKETLEAVSASIGAESILLMLQADLRYAENIEVFLKQLVFPVDAIVFAGGTADYGLFQDVSEATMDEMLGLHLKAPWLITQKLLPEMIKNKSGKIVFITSIWGDIGASNEVIYSAVKGAQNSFVKALAKEVAPSGITVNAISPGFIDTKMNAHLLPEERASIIAEIPSNRAGTPQDVANAVGFLLDEKSSYIQGEILQINGGW